MVLGNNVLGCPPYKYSGVRLLSVDDWLGDDFYPEWDMEDYDTDHYHDFILNPSRITIPKDGYYSFGLTIGRISGVGGNGGHIFISKNRTTIMCGQQAAPGENGKTYYHETSGIKYLVAGDYIEAYIRYDGAIAWKTGSTSSAGGALQDTFVASFWCSRIR